MKKQHTHTMYTTFKADLEQFAQHVERLFQNATLYAEQRFLSTIAQDANKLYTSSLELQESQEAAVKEIGAIVQNIFVQPLAIKADQHSSIKTAAESFDASHHVDTDLSCIMRAYAHHPETTQSFLRELELLAEDFNSILQASA